MKRWHTAVVFSMLLSACSREREAERIEKPATRPVVYATNYPVSYFAQRISTPLIDVRLPVPLGVDPAFWVPTPEDVSALQQADLVLLNGASYESWINSVSLPESRLVVTCEGFHQQFIPQEQKLTHRHGPEGVHEHAATASTTWLDLVLAIEQARAIQLAFARRWPIHRGQFETQFKQLANELESLDTEISEVTKGMTGMPILFSHPVYQYFARHYQVDGLSLHWEPSEMPSESMWQDLTLLLKSHPAKWMIWEAMPMPEIREKLAGLGIQCLVFDPCGGVPSAGDFGTVMKANIEALKAVVTK